MVKIIISVVLVAGVVVAVVAFNNKSAIAPESGLTSSPQAEDTSTVCTQDVRECPDGSFVGRGGPKCEFGLCPGVGGSSSSPMPSVTTGPKTVNIVFNNGVATPDIVTVKVGDSVKFVNNDSSLRWPASGPHPAHTICPGFDSLRGLKTGESYTFTFKEIKACPWHDHLKPSINGKIEVVQ
ncbi:MAG: hypothetical protein AAB784_03025 [Patescibacteria group bacterium]